MNYEPLYTFAEKHRVPYNELCTALREALAAPQPEPVAEVIDREHQPWEHGKHTSWLVNPSDLPAGTKLYAAAPPAAPAPVVPLTDEQFADIVAEASLEVDLAANPLKLLAFARAALSAALREALAAPQPEPEKRIVWCTETDSACSTCPTLRIPCQAATQAAALNARVTVPREPTQEMIAAGEAVFRSYCFRHVNGAIPTYEAMIAAVPAPAAPAVCDGGTCGLGGYCTNCPRLSAAPAVREPQEHIGWCCYVAAHEKATRLVLCDSDAPGAFRVYRGIGGGGNG